jgi:hypothetical protein
VNIANGMFNETFGNSRRQTQDSTAVDLPTQSGTYYQRCFGQHVPNILDSRSGILRVEILLPSSVYSYVEQTIVIFIKIKIVYINIIILL